MKKIFILLSFFAIGTLNAQNANEVSVKRVVDMFYDGLNQRDSIKTNLALSDNISYTKVEEIFGRKVMKSDNLADVVQSIVTIPKTTKFELKNSVLNINVGSHIANVWVESQFYLYGSYYQCGFSSLQLAKQNGDWKIISILDHYSKENCLEQK